MTAQLPFPIASPGRKKSLVKKISLISILIASLTALSASQISGRPISYDASVNLKLAHNYATHQILSIDDHYPYKHSNAREPIPNIVTGLHLRLFDQKEPANSLRQLSQGDGAKLAKSANIYWVILGLVGTAMITWELVGSFPVVMACIFAVGVFFYSAPIFVDTLYTELQAATALILSSWILLKTVDKPTKTRFFICGAFLGILTLTKAIFFQISLAFIALITTYAFLLFLRRKKSVFLPHISAMLLGFVACVMPWMIVNKLQLGNTNIAMRGGGVLYARAIKENMSNSEIPGAIYFWGPSFYQHLANRIGIGAKAADFQAGGRYQHLNRDVSSNFSQTDFKAVDLGRPDLAVSYLRKVGAMAAKYKNQAVKQNIDNPEQYAENKLARDAKSIIVKNPWRHLQMTPLFMWRGIWALPNEGVRVGKANGIYVIFKDLLTLVSYLSLFSIFFLAVYRKNIKWLSITVLPIGMLLAYGFLTHNLPRYTAPCIPLMLISLSIVIDKTSVYLNKSHGLHSFRYNLPRSQT